jgi:hypothetical protein
MKRRDLLVLAMIAAFGAAPALAADEKKKPADGDTFDQDTVLRAGASIGYVHYTPKKTYNPF